MEIPEGALVEDVEITIDQASGDTISFLPLNDENEAIADFGPSVLQFLKPVEVTVPYPSTSEDGSVDLIGIDLEGKLFNAPGRSI